MNRVLSELCYKGTISQRNYRKILIKWSFACTSLLKVAGKMFGNHSMTRLYLNLCYNGVSYKGTALFCYRKLSMELF